ncbi:MULTISPECIES: MotA/TolQ/ExbB proton channel family protein [unclassified Guyparkeria]|uniref:MotA/TolQ/ExbB proton channel family protein n=1 Tax=unclassified Guyparkeria TaxID=2626246 RepID=UPI000733911F|nr:MULTISPECIES: MotA/TolQ/ExbB proton channel family protein [unclassified Guyparkeria]KTG17603.1 biopolymer transporter ExbB [Guyparkeria sp. XI15]OAE88416.1 biopolymer transporter ExbB [Guyparkeria sp. WRN-7]
MLDLVLAGGGMMLPIIIASVIAMAIIFERLYTLRRGRVMGGDPVGMIESWQGQGGITPGRLDELSRTSPLGRILAAGLEGSHSAESMRVRIEDTGRHVAHEMERYLNTLGTIALISPLLGLLGTVIGIIDVFQAITAVSGAGAVAPELLAGGIAKALVTTAAGIMVAVPAFIFHRYFRGLVDELVIDMEADAIRLVDLIHPAGAGRRRAA